jgi:hypothetical protein
MLAEMVAYHQLGRKFMKDGGMNSHDISPLGPLDVNDQIWGGSSS